MAVDLDRPASAEDLYISRGEVPPWRPVLQGDVFADVTVTCDREHTRVLVIAHPCTMRGGGGHLKTSLPAVPVVEHRRLELDDWRGGHFRIMPLPDFETAGTHAAALLDQIGMVASSTLDLTRRRCCLSEEGIVLLQQRFVFSLTRAAVRLETLMAASASVLAEAELQEDWNEKIAQARVESGETLGAALADETERFTAFMSDPRGGPLRASLAAEHLRAGVRREVRAEIGRRRAALDTD